MNNTPASSGKDNENNTESAQEKETLKDRSARLEAEAQALYGAKRDQDPLSPSPVPEEPTMAGDEEYEAMQHKVEALQGELDATKDKMLRAVADAENTKRRALKERDDASKFAVSGFSREMLPVADNLRRALDAIPDDVKGDERIANLIDGIEATERELLRAFEKNGLQKIEPLEQKFDPNFHEVMFETPMADKAPGTIIQVMETGYTLHGRLIRPARVGVVKDDGQGGGTAPGSAEPGHNLDTEA
jgi:molecular chaperone GrpE